MSIENENLSTGDVLKGADDAAARIKAKRAAKAAGVKEEKAEEKMEQAAVSLGSSYEEEKQELGIENEILEGETGRKATLTSELEKSAEVDSGVAPLKQEPELEQDADAVGKKKELTDEEKQKEVKKLELEEIESGWERLRKKIDAVRWKIKEQTTKKPIEKTLEEEIFRLENNKQRFNLIKNSLNVSEKERNRMKKIIEELEKRLKVK